MMDMSDPTDTAILPAPWERQQGESARAFAAFCLFRDIGPRRSLRECCRGFYDGTTANVGQISTGASRWQWVERCRVWDDHLDTVARQEQERQRKEMVERHAKAAEAAVEKAAEALLKIA